MKHRRTFTLAIAFTLFAVVTSGAQGLSDAQVTLAILAGENNRFKHLIAECNARASFGELMGGSLEGGVQQDSRFKVTLSGASGQIALMAAEAKRLYKRLTIADIGSDQRTDVVSLMIEPERPSSGRNSISVAAPIEHVVLKGKSSIVQPIRMDTEPLTWSNLFGGKVENNRAIATFNYADVAGMPAGEIEIAVVTTRGERKCKIDTQDRARVFSRR